MAEAPASRLGVLGGIAGTLLGGFLWVVIYGSSVKQPAISLSALAIGAALWLMARRVHDRFPGHIQALLGATFLVVCALDWLYVALLFQSLPEHSANPYIGISRDALRVLQPILIAGSVTGTALILWDLLRKHPT